MPDSHPLHIGQYSTRSGAKLVSPKSRATVENLGSTQHVAVLSVMRKHKRSCAAHNLRAAAPEMLPCSLSGPGAPSLLLLPWATSSPNSGVQRRSLGDPEDAEAAKPG